METAAHRATWAVYQAAWEDIPSDEREDLLDQSVTDDCAYFDPAGEAQGRKQLIEYVERFRVSRRDRFAITPLPTTTISRCRPGLSTPTAPGGPPGTSYARFAGDGRMNLIVGCFQTSDEDPDAPEKAVSTWTDYQAAWRDINPDERHQLLERSVTDDCIYTDPAGGQSGREALIKYLAQFQQRMPGGYFVNAQLIAHHDHAVAHWTRHGADGIPAISGASYARFGADGRLVQTTGFPDSK